MAGRVEGLSAHFRAALRESPITAFRDWYRTQETLRQEGDAPTACRLAEELWEMRAGLVFRDAEERARFHHNAGVFFGSPGPAADLARARSCFGVALAHYAGNDAGWEARTVHNLATALANLGGESDVAEAIALFERALAYRTSEQEIARGVTLHHLGLAWRRLAELSADEARVAETLEASASALEQAAEIRGRLGLAEGHALSLFHLGLTLEAAAERSGLAPARAAAALRAAGDALERTGQSLGAEAARQRAERLEDRG